MESDSRSVLRDNFDVVPARVDIYRYAKNGKWVAVEFLRLRRTLDWIQRQCSEKQRLLSDFTRSCTSRDSVICKSVQRISLSVRADDVRTNVYTRRYVPTQPSVSIRSNHKTKIHPSASGLRQNFVNPETHAIARELTAPFLILEKAERNISIRQTNGAHEVSRQSSSI